MAEDGGRKVRGQIESVVFMAEGIFLTVAAKNHLQALPPEERLRAARELAEVALTLFAACPKPSPAQLSDAQLRKCLECLARLGKN